MPHFHIPLQSGSNKILRAMRRRYKKQLYSDRISKIKKSIPDACIGVDVIVGFPGETDNDFMDTYNFLNELDISYLHVFTYSERSNTDASNFDNPVSKKNRIERRKMLHILSDKKIRHFYNQFVNTTRMVLLENTKNGKLLGHTDNYIHVQIDGEKQLINTIHPIKLTLNNGNIVSGEI